MGKGEFLFLLQGLKWTLVLAAVAFIGGMVSRLGVALARTSGATTFTIAELMGPVEANIRISARKSASRMVV